MLIEGDGGDRELVLGALRAIDLSVDVREVGRASELAGEDCGWRDFDVVLFGDSGSRFDREGAARLLREMEAPVPLVLVSREASDDDAVALVRLGAVDCVWKDRLGGLGEAIERALARRAQWRLLQESEWRFRSLIEHQLDAFALLSAVRDRDGAVLDLRFEFINEAGSCIADLPVAAHLGRGVLELFPFFLEFGLFERYVEVIETGLPLIADDIELVRSLRGGSGPVYGDVRVFKHGDGCAVSYRDATARHLAREREMRMTRLNGALARVDEEILHVSDRNALYELVCGACVELGGVALASVAEVGDDRLQIAARVSVDPGLERVGICEPAALAVEADRCVLVCDLAADERTAGWRDRAVEVGLGWLAGLPVRCDGRIVAVIVLLGSDRRRFAEQELAFWERLAVSVSYALDAIERESLRRAAERELRRTRDFLAAVTDGMGEGLFTLDSEMRITYVNRAALSMLGWSRDELIGQKVADVMLGESDRGCGCMLCAPESEDAPVRCDEDSFLCEDGTLLPVSFSVCSLPAEADSGFVIVFSDDSARRAERDRLEHELQAVGWTARIRDALDRDGFQLFAQPIVEASTGRVMLHELLLRMREQDGSLIAPGQFLPIAERSQLITEVDKWVVSRAVELASSEFPVAINISAASLGDQRFSAWLRRELAAARVDPANLVFEVTETALLRDEQAGLLFATQLAELGCRLALDDFGTGYGGFTYLKRLHVDLLKIDIEFVRDMLQDPASRHVVTAIINLAEAFGLSTIAEGVEDAATLTALAEMNVEMVQGFHVGRPRPVVEVLSPALDRAGDLDQAGDVL